MAAKLPRCSLGKEGMLHPAGWAAKRGRVTYPEELHGLIGTMQSHSRSYPVSRSDRTGASVTHAKK
jgi:hypothetical protein